MDVDEDSDMPEVTKQEAKVIGDIIEELLDTPLHVVHDQLLSVITKFQVAPEKQMKILLSIAFRLSNMADKETHDKTLSDNYLKLSTMATEVVQERFGSLVPQENTYNSRHTRTAKANAKINMQSFFENVEPALYQDSSDEESHRRKKKKKTIVWSDSELQETEPPPPPPKIIETIPGETDESDSEENYKNDNDTEQEKKDYKTEKQDKDDTKDKVETHQKEETNQNEETYQNEEANQKEKTNPKEQINQKEKTNQKEQTNNKVSTETTKHKDNHSKYKISKENLSYSSTPNRLTRRKTKTVDVVLIDSSSSSDEERRPKPTRPTKPRKQPAPKQPVPKQQAPKHPVPKQQAPKQPAPKQPTPKQPAPKQTNTNKQLAAASEKQPADTSAKPKTPILQAALARERDKIKITDSRKRPCGKKDNDKIKKLDITPSSIKKIVEASEMLTAKAQKIAEKSQKKTSSSDRPVGVVKATPRPAAPADNNEIKRSTSNVIKADEALILNFKKGHYPQFQNHYTHLAMVKKPDNSLFIDTAPALPDILSLGTEIIKSEDLKLFNLKQLVHNVTGQFLVGEQDDTLYLLIPGVIKKVVDKETDGTG